MNEDYLYDIARMRRNEFYSTKPDYIEKAEEELVCEMLYILDGTLSDEEIQTFWEDVPWDRDWKKKKTV